MSSLIGLPRGIFHRCYATILGTQLSFPPYRRSPPYQPVDLVTLSSVVEPNTLRYMHCGKRDREEKHADGRKRPLVRPRHRCGIIFKWI